MTEHYATYGAVLDTVLSVIVSQAGERVQTPIAPTVHLMEQALLDSLGLIQTVLELEARFSLEFMDAELNFTTLATPQSIALILCEKLGISYTEESLKR